MSYPVSSYRLPEDAGRLDRATLWIWMQWDGWIRGLLAGTLVTVLVYEAVQLGAARVTDALWGSDLIDVHSWFGTRGQRSTSEWSRGLFEAVTLCLAFVSPVVAGFVGRRWFRRTTAPRRSAFAAGSLIVLLVGPASYNWTLQPLGQRAGFIANATAFLAIWTIPVVVATVAGVGRSARVAAPEISDRPPE